MKRLLMILAVLCTGMPLMALDLTQYTRQHRELQGCWERFAIDTKESRSHSETLYITGSDARGLAYGVLHVSEAIGVNPWYWFADVPIDVTNISHRDNSFTKKRDNSFTKK